MCVLILSHYVCTVYAVYIYQDAPPTPPVRRSLLARLKACAAAKAARATLAATPSRDSSIADKTVHSTVVEAAVVDAIGELPHLQLVQVRLKAAAVMLTASISPSVIQAQPSLSMMPLQAVLVKAIAVAVQTLLRAVLWHTTRHHLSLA
jgi:hypothetical protein